MVLRAMEKKQIRKIEGRTEEVGRWYFTKRRQGRPL